MLKFEMIYSQFCRLNGGYLAEIQSKVEEDDVDNLLLLDIRYWIGLNDLILEGIFLFIHLNQCFSERLHSQLLALQKYCFFLDPCSST